MVKKAIGTLICSLCTVILFALLIIPQSRVQHEDSSAFQMALNLVVERLEASGETILHSTATPVAADILSVGTTENGYTCDTPTCDTYDKYVITCDESKTECTGTGHTFEPKPYNHTCDGHTCDGKFTCDITADPRAETCNAQYAVCKEPTFNGVDATCNPLYQEFRQNNPKGFCTAVKYPTCDGDNPTCRLEKLEIYIVERDCNPRVIS